MAAYRFPCPIRWGDMDSYGHVNNVVFVQYLEEARVGLFEWLAQVHGTWDMLTTGVLVAAHEIRYRRPLSHRTTPVPIEVGVTEIRAASFDLAYRIADDDGMVYATASTTLVPYDFAAARPRRLTDKEREQLKIALVEQRP